MTMIKPLVFTLPFAENGDFDEFSLVPVINAPNQPQGYPPIFATPYSSGGIPIDAGQTNGIFNAYSTQSVWLQGGGTFTFEPSWITANAGYDAGAILWYAAAKQFVISLVDNNANDFITNPSTIDNVNWQYLSSLSGTTAASDFKYSCQTANHSGGYGTWLRCNGAVYDPIAYPALFAIIGNSFGGTTTAPLLPQGTNRVLGMAGTNTARTSNGAFSNSVPLPQHNHGISQTPHIHPIPYTNSEGNFGNFAGGRIAGGTQPSNGANANITINNAGTAGATMSVVQPTLWADNLFIFAY